MKKLTDPTKIYEVLDHKLTGSYMGDVARAEKKGFTFDTTDYYHAYQLYTYKRQLLLKTDG